MWFNFGSLHDAVDAAVGDPTGTVSEQARFLLRELQALLVEDGLVDSDDVVVVAARFASGWIQREGQHATKRRKDTREPI